MKTLLGLDGMSVDELHGLIDSAIAYREGLAAGRSFRDQLAGIPVGNLFFEASTRTRLSFELAEANLGALALDLRPEASSVSKGESLRDTALTVAAIGARCLVVRHSEAGVPAAFHEWTGLPVINAGDGSGEHPTQGLIDLVTLETAFGAIAGLRVTIVGDIVHSRVAASLIPALRALGSEVTVVGPDSLLPAPSTDALRSHDLDPVLSETDVVYLLRVQTERGAITDDDYTARYQMDVRRASMLPPEAVVMHPGPMNRGVEVSDEVADGPRSLVLHQVSNGVAVRMAVLAELCGVGG